MQNFFKHLFGPVRTSSPLHSPSLLKEVQERGKKDHKLPSRPASRPPLPSTSSRGDIQCTTPQTKSLFFTKLPFELRLRIYEDIFGYRKAHLVFPAWQDGSWSHSVCTIKPECSFFYWDHWCRKKEVPEIRLRSKGDFDLESHESKLDIAMLHTCRQAYCEGVSVLYSTTTFDFSSSALLQQFRFSIPPPHLLAVTSIDLRWHCGKLGQPHLGAAGKQNWDALWAFLASLLRLRALRLLVLPPRSHYIGDGESCDFNDAWLSPLKKFGEERMRMDIFDIALPKCYYDRFEKEIDEAQYRLINIVDRRGIRA